MNKIEILEANVIYQNPVPHLRSRQAKFPGLARLSDQEIICLFEMGEAFESVDSHTCVTRSLDNGRTWNLEGDLYDMSRIDLGFPVSETLKPTVLKDGSLMAVGLRYHRKNPDQPIGNPETGGLLPGDNVVCFSSDRGKTWTVPFKIDHGFPELLETSGPAVQLGAGDLLMIGCPFKMWDGSNPDGQDGYVLRSTDMGRTWSIDGKFFATPDSHITPWESRLCEMQPGRLVSIVWAFDLAANRHLPNHVTVSHDDGKTWSDPIDTGIMGQASNLMWAGGDMLVSVHAHRAGDVGLFVRIVDFSKDEWRVIDQDVVWGRATAQNTDSDIIDQFANLKFGQPSLLDLGNGELLAVFWCCEDGLYKIRSIRLKWPSQFKR